MDTMTNQEKLNTFATVRKGYTKTHTVKIGDKQFITFDYYRSLILGKRNKTWCNTVDIILDVKRNEYGLIDYIVKDEKSGEVRSHGTRISIKEVY
jgi:hypothetical protein